MPKREVPKPTTQSLARAIARDSIVTKALSRLLEQVVEEIYVSNIEPLKTALKDVVMHARTSGGSAGPDAGLMAACARAEKLLNE